MNLFYAPRRPQRALAFDFFIYPVNSCGPSFLMSTLVRPANSPFWPEGALDEAFTVNGLTALD